MNSTARTPKTHPLTGAPIVPAGFRRNGAPIWPIMGGSGEGDGGDAGGDSGGDTGGDTGGDAGQQQGAGDTGDSGDKTGDSPWADPKAAQAEIERLRRENASNRVKNNTAAEEARKAMLDEFAQKLGLKEGDTAPTVEELTAKLTDQTAKTDTAASLARDTQAELIVWKNATDLKVDAQALTDSRAFEKAIKDLDPASDTFATDVKAAAQEALKNNPKLGATQVAGSSSIDHPGGGGATRRTEAPSISDAVTAALGS